MKYVITQLYAFFIKLSHLYKFLETLFKYQVFLMQRFKLPFGFVRTNVILCPLYNPFILIQSMQQSGDVAGAQALNRNVYNFVQAGLDNHYTFKEIQQAAAQYHGWELTTKAFEVLASRIVTAAQKISPDGSGLADLVSSINAVNDLSTYRVSLDPQFIEVARAIPDLPSPPTLPSKISVPVESSNSSIGSFISDNIIVISLVAGTVLLIGISVIMYKKYNTPVEAELPVTTVDHEQYSPYELAASLEYVNAFYLIITLLFVFFVFKVSNVSDVPLYFTVTLVRLCRMLLHVSTYLKLITATSFEFLSKFSSLSCDRKKSNLHYCVCYKRILMLKFFQIFLILKHKFINIIQNFSTKIICIIIHLLMLSYVTFNKTYHSINNSYILNFNIFYTPLVILSKNKP